jgi:hypothetical protein
MLHPLTHTFAPLTIDVAKPLAKYKWKRAVVTVGGGRGFIVRET